MSRLVISWFGCALRDLELIEDNALADWVERVEDLCEGRFWSIERLGNPIDLIIGAHGRSISPREFFAFQRAWDALNEEFGFQFSGVLNLMSEDHEWSPELPRESYVNGRVRSGDSVGRPSRHRIRERSRRPAAALKQKGRSE
jgi:hypothetical protein